MQSTATQKLENTEDIALKFALLEKGVKEMEKEYAARGLTDPTGKLREPRIEDISVQGFVGSIPRVFGSDEKVVRFRMAIKSTNKSVKWVTVSLKGEIGVKIAREIEKGMSIFVSGRIFYFPNPQTGDEKTGRQVIFANQIFRLAPFNSKESQ